MDMIPEPIPILRPLPGWAILPFSVVHDAAEPFGYLIAKDEDRLLFIPDTAYVKNRFPGITMIAVECNHIADILHENIVNGSLPPVVGKRSRRNHMELGVLIEMLKANDLSRCGKIWLLHLSDGISDEARMIREVQEATGVPTHAAQMGGK